VGLRGYDADDRQPLLSAPLAWLVAFGVAQAVAGLCAVRRFATQPVPPPAQHPPITILKPVCGDEALLEQAIESFCRQDYPHIQLVIGAHDAADPALAVARRVQARFPQLDITLLADPTLHGPNRKISNLINMLPLAKHDVLVFADSDLHAGPHYLTHVVAALLQPATGLVTTLSAGEPAVGGLAARLGATHITHSFLPGVLLSVLLGRQDCLGTTMALRREVLEQVGGLHALVGHLADDNVLSCLVRQRGLAVRLAHTLPVVSVQERAVRALWQHELRWARTTRALAPLAFAASTLQYPLFWALLWGLTSHGSTAASMAFLAAWAVRWAVAAGINAALAPMRARPAHAVPGWLLPLRDVLSVAEIIVSFGNDQVVWRGHRMRAGRAPGGSGWVGRAAPMKDGLF
jgi:ceramide glucosyltransferase